MSHRSGPPVPYQKLALGLTTTTLAIGGQVLPEEGVVEMTTAVEVEQRGLGSSRSVVVLGLGVADGLDSSVVSGDVGLVVLGVVQLHDLARDVGLERAIVICRLVSKPRQLLRLLGRKRVGAPTRKVGERRLAADEAGAGDAEGRLDGAGPEAGAQGGSSSEESRGHCGDWIDAAVWSDIEERLDTDRLDGGRGASTEGQSGWQSPERRS